jgi:O-antigen/teichoic acid export membrane protein
MQFGLSVLVAIINFKNLSKYIAINKASFSNLDLRKHIKPLLYIFLTIFSISIYFSLDTILLGFLANNESVGYYSTALKLNKLIIAVFSAVTVAIFPSLINLYHSQEIDKFRELIRQVFFVLVSLSIPTIVIFISCAKEIVHVLFSENFDRSILPLQITAPLILIVSMSSIFGFQVLSALAKDKQILYSAIIGMSVSILFSLLLVPSLMEVGEAVTILITELSVSLSFIYFTKKYFKVGGLTKMFFKQLLGALPYIFFVIVFKSIMNDSVIVLTSISIISFIWFCIYHLLILKESYFKIYLNSFIQKLQA